MKAFLLLSASWYALEREWQFNVYRIDVNNYVGIDQNGWKGCYYAFDMNHLK